MRIALSLSLSLLVALPALAAGPGSASGTLTINGKVIKLTHAYAARKADAPFRAAPKETGTEALKGTQLPAGGGDPGKAYMAYTKVLAAGDLKALRKALTADRAKSLDDPDFKAMFPMIQAMQAKDIKVTGGAVDGDTATLMATGKDGDATSHGTIAMVREGGAWK